MTLYVAPLVEGHGEQLCLPSLLYRIWGEILRAPESLRVLDPFRKPRSGIVQQAQLANYIQEAFLKLQQESRKDPASRLFVLIVIDAEEECPKDLAPQLLKWALEARSDADIACVLPNPMFETWFAAAASSLAGVNGLPADLTCPADPEGTRLGKRWLKKQLPRKYSETVDQPRFAKSLSGKLLHP